MSETSESRLSHLERQSAAQSTDIRGIYAGLDEIRDVLIRIQENAKPNLGAMFLVLLATCTFIVTIGGLTLAPVYKHQNRMHDSQVLMAETISDIRSDRFNRKDAEDLEDKLRTQSIARDKELKEIIRQNAVTISNNRAETAYLQGRLDTLHRN